MTSAPRDDARAPLAPAIAILVGAALIVLAIAVDNPSRSQSLAPTAAPAALPR